MPVSIPASVADLAMTVPTMFAAALGIWFAGTTAILLSETRLTRRITKFRLFNAWPATPRSTLGLSDRIGAAFRDCQTDKRRPTGSLGPSDWFADHPHSSANCGVCLRSRCDAPHFGTDDRRLLNQRHRSIHPTRSTRKSPSTTLTWLARGFALFQMAQSSTVERSRLVRCCRSNAAAVRRAARQGASISDKRERYSSTAIPRPMWSWSAKPIFPMRIIRRRSTI